MIIKCDKRYSSAMAHAEQTNDQTLKNCLDRLSQWEENNDWEVILCHDFAPLSFYFVIKDKTGRQVMNGGVLYHGEPDESGAVTLDPTKGWQIHT